MSVTLDPTTPPTDSTASACVRCGYNLHGIDQISGRCPECGLKAYWSLRARQQLAQYPPRWVSTMAWAARLLMMTYGTLALFLVAILAANAVADNSRFQRWGELLFSYVLAAATVPQMLGMWMLATHSRHRSEPAALLNRWVLRVSSPAMVIAAAAAVAMSWYYRPWLGYVVVGGVILGSIAPTAVFVRLRTVARLIADPGLAEHSAIVGVGFLFVAAGIGALITFGPSHPGSDSLTFFVILMAIATAALLFPIWAAFILLFCVIDFGRAARVARAAWRADAPDA